MKQFKINDKVKIKNTNIYGKIINLTNTTITLKTLDAKSVTTSVTKIDFFDYKENTAKVSLNYNVPKREISNEIMLRHLTKEEAISKLEIFLSDAILTKQYKIKIIHGKNGGILREAVHEYLKSSPFIEKYELAGYFEGQYGVTIAYLKK